MLPKTPETVIFELFSDTRTLGQKKELEGKVTFNPDRCHIFYIPPVDTISSLMVPDRTKWDLYLVIMPFTLHPAPGERYYEELTFFVKMMDEQVTAFDLFPRSITADVEESQPYTLSSQTKFQEVGIKPAQSGRSLYFSALRPSITVFGEGQNTFYWVHKKSKEQSEVIPETKHALVILQVPCTSRFVEAEMSYEAVMARKLFGVWKSSDCSTYSHKVRWQLERTPSFLPEDPMNGPVRTNVFVSCSHNDKKYLTELRTHLKPYVRLQAIKTWDDSMIMPGTLWLEEMMHAIQTAKVAILLVSASFLASDFIFKKELPPRIAS